MPSTNVPAGLALAGAAALTLVLALTSLVAPSSAAVLDRGPLVVFTELRGASSLVWTADPETPSRRRSLSTLPHRDGYGPRVVPAPDGRRLAVSLLPPEASDLGHEGQLLLLAPRTGESQLLLENINARGMPLWAPDGRSLAVKRLGRSGPELLVVEAGTGALLTTISAPDTQDLFPVGWTPDGATLYVAVQTPRGFDLRAAAGSVPGTLRPVASLSDGPARDFRLAPDGRGLSYVAAGSGAASDGFRPWLLDLAEPAGDRPLRPQRLESHEPVLGALWQPGGAGLTIAPSAPPGLRLLTLDGAVHPLGLSQRPGGFDLPLAWSPGGRFLAVRHLIGPDLERLSGEALDILGENGHRTTVEAAGPVSFAGWLPVARP